MCKKNHQKQWKPSTKSSEELPFAPFFVIFQNDDTFRERERAAYFCFWILNLYTIKKFRHTKNAKEVKKNVGQKKGILSIN
jgi:hypothetical protein